MFLRYQHPGYSGTLNKRLEDFKLDKSFANYRLLIQGGWLKPAFHVPIPTDWFWNDSDYPTQNVNVQRDVPHWADDHDKHFVIAKETINTDEWYLHPLVRKGSSGSRFFDHDSGFDRPEEWVPLVHSPGRSFIPAFDYFYEWQLFQLADRIEAAKARYFHYWQPGDLKHLVASVQAFSAEEFDTCPELFSWHKRETPFTWLAHFVAFRQSFQWYRLGRLHESDAAAGESRTKILAELEKLEMDGAKSLMTWLGITPLILELEFKQCFLVQACEWHRREMHITSSTRPLWQALQAQIFDAVRWLELTTGYTLYDYLDRLRPDYLGYGTWLPLERVIQDPLWKAARKFSDHVAERNDGRMFSEEFVITPLALANLAVSWPSFATYVNAVGRFIEDCEHHPDDDLFRPRNRASWYRIIAVSAEILLKEQLPLEFRGRPVQLRDLESALGIARDDAVMPKAKQNDALDRSRTKELGLAAQRIRDRKSVV